MPWYKTTALWNLARRAKLALRRQRTIKMGGSTDPFEIARLARANAPKIDSLPSLTAPLIEYRRNLNAMADLASAAGVRLVFLTQPSAWRDRMSDVEEHQLWLGSLPTDGVSARAYLTTRALASAMARYNETLLAVCRLRGLACVDAANLLPHDLTDMYDEVHFNEQGSRLLARVLAEYFRHRSPFLRPT
jgi:hypothetical protein